MKEYAPFFYTLLKKARRLVRIDKQQFWTEKAKSVPGFEPGLHGQNAIALPLTPPPLQLQKHALDFEQLLLSACGHFI